MASPSPCESLVISQTKFSCLSLIILYSVRPSQLRGPSVENGTALCNSTRAKNRCTAVSRDVLHPSPPPPHQKKSFKNFTTLSTTSCITYSPVRLVMWSGLPYTIYIIINQVVHTDCCYVVFLRSPTNHSLF